MPHSYSYYLLVSLAAPIVAAIVAWLFYDFTGVRLIPRCAVSLDAWVGPPETYPRRGPRFWYGLILLSAAAYGVYASIWRLFWAELTVWILVMAPVLINACVVCYRMLWARQNRWRQMPCQNPLLDLFACQNKGTSKDPFSHGLEAIRKHSWGIPTGPGLQLIKEQGKIIEVCAGTGYWAWMLFQLDVDVIAYDISPGPTLRNSYHRFRLGWFPVRKGDSAQAAIRHADRALMFCWPTNNAASARALAAYQGERVIYIGANDVGSNTFTGDKTFHRLLKEGWRLIRAERLPCWGELKDSVRVYERLPIDS
jgi:hypothetical protein